MSRLSTAAHRGSAAGRRGAILVVVLALLAIFAVVGISFVFYSDGEALAARYHREAQSSNGQMRPSDPGTRFDTAAETVLGKLIFGDYNGQLNSYRGHDLMSAMYGGQGTNTDPYTGQGIFHEPLPSPTFDSLKYPLPGGGTEAVSSRGHVVNYTPLQIGQDAGGNPVYYGFDPEYTGPPRAWINATPPAMGRPEFLPTDGSGRTYVSKAAPYTYPDLNNFYLASLSPATGEVIAPSFYRPWHFNANNPNVQYRLFPWNPGDTAPGTNTAANTDWVTAEGRTRTLRPRPVDQLDATDLNNATGKTRLPTAAELPAVAGKLYAKIDEKIRSGDIIGYPRPNQDGLVTGDVFNLIGGVGVQRNDSILVDFGGTPFEWPKGSGRYVKPLAAVLISDLDGLLNLNAHGNARGAGGNHTSYHGLGPWEVNLAGAMGNVAEGNAIVASRYGSAGAAGLRSRNGTPSYAYSPSAGRFGAYGLVAWDATGKAGAVTFPQFPTNPFFTTATYTGTGFYDDNTSLAQQANHPALYNPGDWPAFPEGQALNPLPGNPSTYPHADTRRLRQRYAGELDLYNQTSMYRLNGAPINALIGNGGTYAPGTANYKNDPAHGRRLLVTTLSTDLDRPRMMGAPGGSISLAANTIHPTNAGLTNPLPAGTGSSVMPALDIHRPLADYRDLGSPPNVSPDPADMTKTIPTPQPLSPGNATNAPNAGADRQNFAREIFARLILASGGNAKVDVTNGTGDVTILATTGNPDYDALRYLAQLAANVVDYIDNDDISTTFVWSPNGGGAANPLQVMDAATYAASLTANMSSQTDINARVVFGVEMPRLVLNEVYSEVTDDEKGKGKGKGKGMPDKEGHVRFWVEMVNPTFTPYSTGTGPLGDGSAALNPGGGVFPYKLTIARNAKGGKDVAVELGRADNVTGLPPAGSADLEYNFVDAKVNKGVDNSIVRPNNGKYDAAGNPTLGIVIAGPTVKGATAGDEFDPAAGGMAAAPWDNMILSPDLVPGMPATPAMEYLIPVAELQGLKLTDPNSPFRRHVVMLRRLANPYATESPTNPYVTVDYMDYVPSNDGVATGNGGGMGNGGVPINQRFSVGRVQPLAGQALQTNGAMNVPSYTFPTSFLLAQRGGGAGNEPKHTFGRHNGESAGGPAGSTSAPAAMGGAQPPTTGVTPGTETILAPFDWFFHPDRPLINEMELLHVQAVKPHQVTQYTFQPPKNPGEPVRKNLGLAPWFGVWPATAVAPASPGDPTYDTTTGLPSLQTAPTTPHLNATGNGLYRGLELLRGKSRVFGTATGGRVQGKLNINTIQDPRVLIALLDPQLGNAFTGVEVYDAGNPKSQGTLWGRFIGSRTRGLSTRALANGNQVDTTTPGKTVDDDPYDPNALNLDRPFKAFGVAEAGMKAGYATTITSPPEIIVGGGSSMATDGAMPTPNPIPFGPGLQDTLLRVNPLTHQPIAYTAGPAAPAPNHPYLQAEALRKLMGNTTTVSNAFAFHVTIVYHQVRGIAPPNVEQIPGVGFRHYIGSEAFMEVPGDMRRQYFALVDRTNAAVTDTTSNTYQNAPFQAAVASGFTVASTTGTGTFSLANATLNGNGTVSVASDGQVFTLSSSSSNGINTLFVGSGADRLQVNISAIDPMTGAISVTQPGAGPYTGRTFPAGAVVSNAVPGVPATANRYPAGFSPLTPTHPYQLLVPYCGRVR